MKEFEELMEYERNRCHSNGIFDIFISRDVNVVNLFTTNRRYLYDKTVWLNIWADILTIGQEILNE